MNIMNIVFYFKQMKSFFGHYSIKKTNSLTLFIIITLTAGYYPFKALATPGVQDIIYVDCQNGVDQSVCGTDTSPCKTIGYAAPLMDGGQNIDKPDIMYIKGTCSVVGSSSYNSPTIYPRGSYIKYTTWPKQPQAFIDGGASPTGTVIGATKWNLTDITLENLQINGEIVFRGTINLLIKDCNLWGGGTKDTVNLGIWSDVLLTEDCPHGHVINNKIHDANGTGTEGTIWTHYGKRTGNAAENFVAEYNDIYVSNSPRKSYGLFLKDNPESFTVRNNFFHNLLSGVYGGNQPVTGHNVTINNNIFLDCGYAYQERGAIEMMTEIDGVSIYNNTFINSIYADIGNKNNHVSFSAFNNLHYSNAPFIKMSYGSTINLLVSYLNYNSYYSPSGKPVWEESTKYNGLTEWKSFLTGISKPDVSEKNSAYGNQDLLNFAGIAASSFRLTPLTPQNIIRGGRGAKSKNYANYMGAWDPNKVMWIGYCDKGIRNCDISGYSDAISPTIKSITP